MEYGWKEGAHLSGDANVVGQELDELRRRMGGSLTPEKVVDQAKSKRSALHGYFEWDDAEAAHQHRLDQARHLIRHIVVIKNGDQTPRRAFISVGPATSQVYMDTVEAMKDDKLRILILTRAAAELASFERKYQELEELARVIAVARTTRKRIQKVIQKTKAG